MDILGKRHRKGEDDGEGKKRLEECDHPVRNVPTPGVFTRFEFERLGDEEGFLGELGTIPRKVPPDPR